MYLMVCVAFVSFDCEIILSDNTEPTVFEVTSSAVMHRVENSKLLIAADVAGCPSHFSCSYIFHVQRLLSFATW